jgi:hypothetical protein
VREEDEWKELSEEEALLISLGTPAAVFDN